MDDPPGQRIREMKARALFIWATWAGAVLVAFWAAAGSDAETPPPVGDVAAVVDVTPAGGATDVDPTQPVVVEFDHAMMPQVSECGAVHEGGVRGPEVAGAWSWADENTRLTFTPSTPLKAATVYTVRLEGAMSGAYGMVFSFTTAG